MSLLSSFTFVSRPTLYASLAGVLLISLANVPVVSAMDAADHREDHIAHLHALGTRVGHTTFIDVDSRPFEEAVHAATIAHDRAFFDSLHADTVVLKVGPKSVDGITKAIRFADEGAHVQLALAANHLTGEIRRALTHAPAAKGSLKVSLKFFDPSAAEISSADLEEAMQLPNIEDLDLSGQRLTEENAQTLAPLLRRNNRLRSLDLSRTQIGLNGLKALATSLTDNTTLQTLNLSGNKIDDEGAEILGRAFPANTTLQTLGLGLRRLLLVVKASARAAPPYITTLIEEKI